jgi:hypothetical protein
MQDFVLFRVLVYAGFRFIQSFGLCRISFYSEIWFMQDFVLFKSFDRFHCIYSIIFLMIFRMDEY